MANLLRLVACLFVLLSFNAFAVEAGFPFTEQKVNSSDSSFGFGRSVALDGNTAMIGSNGAVYVFNKIDGNWSETQKITVSNGHSFGYGEISLKGNLAIIGDPTDGIWCDGSGEWCSEGHGSAYVFEYVDNTWTQSQKLVPSLGNSIRGFGSTISMDENIAVFGIGQNSSEFGFAIICEKENGQWSEKQVLIPSTGFDRVDTPSVAIDGDQIFVGHSARTSSTGQKEAGSVFVFKKNAGVWTENEILHASDIGSYSSFGNSLSFDDDYALIGNYGSKIYSFSYNGTSWGETQSIASGPGHFGRYLSMRGNIAVVASFDVIYPGSGSAFIFKKIDNNWINLLALPSKNSESYYTYGENSLTTDGESILIGTYDLNDQSCSHCSGNAYFLSQLSDTPTSITGATSASLDIGGFGFGTLIATDVDGLTDGSYFTISSPPVNGQALINAATGNWIYTANNSFIGSDPFTVTVTDDLGGTTEQVVSITITAPDSDGDGAYDHQDNCPSVSNADQANLDGDAFGDACDSDIDGDGVDNTLDAFPNDPTESSDSDSDNIGDNADNCLNAANFDQSDIDFDTLGDACDSDMDGDGYANVFEVRFGGDETDNTDAAVSLANAVAFSETAPADSDLDGIIDSIETAAGTSNSDPSDGDQAELSALEALGINKQVPAMGGIGLLALGLSMLGLGAVRSRQRH